MARSWKGRAHVREEVAGGGPALLLSVGVTLLAEGAVVAHRAFTTSGGQQWQARVTGQHAASH